MIGQVSVACRGRRFVRNSSGHRRGLNLESSGTRAAVESCQKIARQGALEDCACGQSAPAWADVASSAELGFSRPRTCALSLSPGANGLSPPAPISAKAIPSLVAP